MDVTKRECAAFGTKHPNKILYSQTYLTLFALCVSLLSAISVGLNLEQHSRHFRRLCM